MGLLHQTFDTSELLESVAAIQLNKATARLQRPCQKNLLSNPIPTDLRFRSRHYKKTLPARLYVEDHYDKTILEDQMAKLCGMNPSSFSRCFKKEYAINFRDYLIEFRIRKASKLLQNPHASISDIAFTVGFRDPSYFTRTFKRLLGKSPSCYRNMNNIH